MLKLSKKIIENKKIKLMVFNMFWIITSNYFTEALFALTLANS